MTVTPADISREWRMLIDGKLVLAEAGATSKTESPATQEVIAEVPEASAGDVDDAVQAARRASQAWRDLSWAKRRDAVLTFARELDRHSDELAGIDAIDAGLPVSSMRADVASTVEELQYFAGLGGETKGTTYPSGPGNLTFTEFVPFPVVARIVPFNHPIKFAAGKCAAALVAGAPVVVKPGEHTSLSALRMGEIAAEVFPAGVLNVVTGRGDVAGAALAGHPDVPRVAFTGSVATGVRIAELGAKHIKRVSLELGGKNPFILFSDADLEAAAKAAVAGMNFARCMGQSCGSTSRAFVHADVYDDFVDLLVAEVRRLRIGDPRDESTDIGPMAFAGHFAKVMGMIDAGKGEGARLLTGGGRPAGHDVGYFVEPTVFGGVDMSMRVAREEIFGPVLSLFSWRDEDQVVAEANALDVGLTATVWTNDISTALRTARRLDAGYVTVNGSGKRPVGSPFGGFKHSGVGKESSIEELLSYGEQKAVNIVLR